MSTETKKTVTWGWVIFWSLFFCPAAIYLVIKRLGADDNAVDTEMVLRGSRTFAKVYIGIGIAALLMAFMDPTFFLSVLLFGGGGVLVLSKAKTAKVPSTVASTQITPNQMTVKEFDLESQTRQTSEPPQRNSKSGADEILKYKDL